MAISWKWSHHTQKVMAPPICSIDFGSFISLNPGRSGSCSSWQSCRTRLVLQLCQLQHLLSRLGFGDNHCQSNSVSQSSFCLNESRARRRGRPAIEQRRHWAPVRHLWPQTSAPDIRMTSMATPRAKWMCPLPPSSLCLARNAVAVESPSQAYSGELERSPRCIAAHQNSPIAPPWPALQPPPANSPWNPPVSRHFQLPPNRVAVTFFSRELNAELLEASRLLWLGSRASLGPYRAFVPLGGRSTALTVAGHDAQRRRVWAGVRPSRG